VNLGIGEKQDIAEISDKIDFERLINITTLLNDDHLRLFTIDQLMIKIINCIENLTL